MPNNLRGIVECFSLSLFVYFALASMGLQFAIPPGYASPMWPAAGAALGMALFWGRCAGLGIAAGSMLANYVANPDAPLLMNLFIGLGAGAQAWVGCQLVRRCVNSGLLLIKKRTVAGFFLCGVASCLVNAVNGPFWVYLFGVVEESKLLTNMAFWWLGDSLGVIVCTPIVMALLHPSPVWRPRRTTLVPIQTLTLVFHATLFIVLRDVLVDSFELTGFQVWMVGTLLAAFLAVMAITLMVLTIRMADIGAEIRGDPDANRGIRTRAASG